MVATAAAPESARADEAPATTAPTAAAPARVRGPLAVGTARAVPGQTTRGALKVGEAADGSAIELPVSIVAGRKPGPVVWIEALAHGDEYGSARALHDVLAGLDAGTMSGSVVAVPVANPLALRGLQRTNPDLDDLMDSGDAFPGDPGGFFSQRVAAAIFTDARLQADYFVDLHTGGDRFRQYPFILYTLSPGVPAGRYDDLARGFGIPTLWRDTTNVFPSNVLAHLGAAGIPSFLVEVGGSQPVDPADVRLQADAVRSFLRHVKVLPGSPARPAVYRVVTGFRIVTNDRGGLFEAAVKAGDRVKEGTLLGTITSLDGEIVERLRAPAGSEIVLGVSTYPAAGTGAWLFELGSGLHETP